MGTDGYKAYRHKGLYFVYYNQWDSYLTHFGLKVLHEIPRASSKEEFEEWARSIREYLDAQYEELKDLPIHSGPAYVADKQPIRGMVEWTYEIDLDHLVFLVDCQPMFRLDNMPPDDVFLNGISFDHFGHGSFHEHMPVEYRYNWHAPPPPPLPRSLVAYNSCPNHSSTSSVHELLRIPMTLSSIERARTALAELLVAESMTKHDVGHFVRVLESAPNRDHIPERMLMLALSLANFSIGLPIPSRYGSSYSPTWDFIWIRKDVCLRITTHLDDEDNLQASVGDLVHLINTTQDKVGTVYGVACSIFHCAIVRVDKDVQGTSFAHTPGLQLLPSFYATKISTPGIEALSRLGCQTSGAEFLTAIAKPYYHQHTTQHTTYKWSPITRSVAAKVPVEVWTNVGRFIARPEDLASLASISPLAMSAAADLARYPWVMGVRLVDAVGSVSLIPETEETADEEYKLYHCKLGCANFIAVDGGRRINLGLGQVYLRALFGDLADLSDPVTIMKKEVYSKLGVPHSFVLSSPNEIISS
jgi:hypothetical protein